MKINEKAYKWSGYLTKRAKTDCILLHHAAASVCSPDDIHRIHLMNGWAGIGYHFFVAKDGNVYRGRPLDALGAHVSGHNSHCLGICFEGNFEKETMPEIQQMAGCELVEYLKAIYPEAEVKKHKDLNPSACPGKNFPFDKIAMGKAEIIQASEIVKSLGERGIMTNSALWNEKCASNENAYWLARKICNMTKKAPQREVLIESANDIVWELNHRGIITNKPLWLDLMSKDKDLYWLGYKAANFTQNKGAR